MITETLYYVLREGSTREEQWSWDDIESLLRSGELTGSARIFLPDETRWAFISETRLGALEGRAPDDGAADEDTGRAALEEAYQAALDRVPGGDLEALLEAGTIALQIGRQEDAREHFQILLNRFPYHPRAAQEIHRRFSPAEQRKFRSLERPAPVWEDLGGAAAMPLARGPIHFLAPAAVFAALGFLPFAPVVTAIVSFLWVFQIMEYTARGALRTPDWDRAWRDPVRKLVRPLALMAIVVGQWAVVLAAIAWVAMLAGGVRNESVLHYMADSPPIVVVTWIIAALYLPAAAVSTGGFNGSAAQTIDPRRLVSMVIRMEHEYVYSAGLLCLVAVGVAVSHAFTGNIPVVGNLVAGFALAYALPLQGLILGRLLGRTGHLIS